MRDMVKQLVYPWNINSVNGICSEVENLIHVLQRPEYIQGNFATPNDKESKDPPKGTDLVEDRLLFALKCNFVSL
jgi:hypothetical protein